MYLRFTAPAPRGRWTVTRANVAPGLFRSGYDIWSGDRDNPIAIAIMHELDWFNDNLPVPTRFAVKAKGVWWRDGICWFRDDAGEVLRRAYVLASLIKENGIRIDRVTSRDPGQILYRDRWQVVAKPERCLLH